MTYDPMTEAEKVSIDNLEKFANLSHTKGAGWVSITPDLLLKLIKVYRYTKQPPVKTETADPSCRSGFIDAYGKHVKAGMQVIHKPRLKNARIGRLHTVHQDGDAEVYFFDSKLIETVKWAYLEYYEPEKEKTTTLTNEEIVKLRALLVSNEYGCKP